MATPTPSNVSDVALGDYGVLHQDIPDPKQQTVSPSARAADGLHSFWSTAITTLSPWTYELLSLLLSILAFVAIIIFLRVYDDKPLSQWGLPISLNAVVSILSAVFRGSLAIPITQGISQLKWIWFSHKSRSLADIEVFDRASRGPWGSFLLIVKQFARGKKSYLGSLGALIVIVSLAVDPFSQAMVDYYSCLRQSSGRAAIPRANNYTAFGAHIFVGDETLDGAMQLAVYLGLLHPPVNSSASVIATCPSGNCTFPSDQGATFSTLSMCHSCLDLTNTVVKNTGTWNFSLPGGPSIIPSVLLDTGFAPVGEDFWWKQTTLVTFEALMMKYTDPGCHGSANCPLEPFAFSCSLTPCLKTYAANFTNSVYHEKELSAESLRWGPWTRDFSHALNRTIHNGTWKDCSPTNQQTQANTLEVFVGNDTVTNGSQSKNQVNHTTGTEPATMWYPQECVYTISSIATGSMAGFVSGFFGGEINQLQFAAVPEANTGPTWLKTLWNNGSADLGSVSSFVEGIATSMGGQIRTNAADSGDGKFTLGQVWETQTCIAVHWPFLSFLATLLGLEIAFFVAVIIANQLSPWTGDWKSSTLALLFHGAGDADYTNTETIPLSSVEMMHKTAKKINVRLEEGDGGWRLFRGI